MVDMETLPPFLPHIQESGTILVNLGGIGVIIMVMLTTKNSNHRHALLQNFIERAIGVLKKRFPLLKVGNHYPIESQIRIHAACVVFHNIIRGQNGDEAWLDHQPALIPPATYVDVPDGDDAHHHHEVELNNGNDLRDQIALQMCYLIVLHHLLVEYCSYGKRNITCMLEPLV
jgi:hypothetical protein